MSEPSYLVLYFQQQADANLALSKAHEENSQTLQNSCKALDSILIQQRQLIADQQQKLVKMEEDRKLKASKHDQNKKTLLSLIGELNDRIDKINTAASTEIVQLGQQVSRLQTSIDLNLAKIAKS